MGTMRRYGDIPGSYGVCGEAEWWLQRLRRTREVGREQLEAVVADARIHLKGLIEREDNGTVPDVVAELIGEIQRAEEGQ
ncbi:MAG: hypothetical protein G01um101425_967 [Candidatus Peregrinibacteria bacterium Gr01-1014_25]|nr:MAG: hypothetical protein G01um101425_967 [Candidatus Peregrinibacteria bacterium Gr01-1014_25]